MNARVERKVDRMAGSSDGRTGGLGTRDAIRVLRLAGAASRASGLVTDVTGGTILELMPSAAETPRLQPASPVEGEVLQVRELGLGGGSGFVAFLDGVQASRVVCRVGTLPIVHGAVAAVVRRRSARTLRTWPGGLRVARALFVPLSAVSADLVRELRSRGADVLDTTEGASAGAPTVQHPLELLALARSAVQRRREALELTLAEQWCAAAEGMLLVDGGISSQGAAASSTLAVGVVKSHRTLYVAEDLLEMVLAMPVAHRTTAFEVRSPRRTAVASWYLRLHAPRDLDPLFGLVRVEVAREGFSSERADDVSRWVLAERAPVSLPDSRWHTMSYGVRDCEAYLRAIVV